MPPRKKSQTAAASAAAAAAAAALVSPTENSTISSQIFQAGGTLPLIGGTLGEGSVNPSSSPPSVGTVKMEKGASVVKQRRRKEDYYDRRDFTKPFPIGCHLFCQHPSTGLFYGALVIDRRRHDASGAVLPDPELEQYFKKRAKPVKRRRGAAEKQAPVEEEEEEAGEEDMAAEPYDPDGVHAVPPEFAQHHYSYYIHYVSWDRRMDEWVCKDRLRLPEFVSDSEMAPLRVPPVPEERQAELHAFERKRTGAESRVERLERQMDEVQHAMHLISHGNFSLEDILAHEEATRVKNITTVHLGRYALDAWYYSPYPAEICGSGVLHLCEYCLAPFEQRVEHERHAVRCALRHPPGNEIYRSQERNVCVAAFEVDGAKETVYCENLCLLAKLFLDHKTLEYDCTPFLFYVVCEVDERGYHMVGYFSKEKESAARYNLACILALPCHQRKGYGRFLISLSYELSKLEKKLGSPEKPISDLGQRSYNSYWSATLLSLLAPYVEESLVSVNELATQTSIEPSDIIDTLKLLKLLVYYRDGWVLSYTRLQQLLADREAARAKREAAIRRDPQSAMVAECRAGLLRWTPFLLRPGQN